MGTDGVHEPEREDDEPSKLEDGATPADTEARSSVAGAIQASTMMANMFGAQPYPWLLQSTGAGVAPGLAALMQSTGAGVAPGLAALMQSTGAGVAPGLAALMQSTGAGVAPGLAALMGRNGPGVAGLSVLWPKLNPLVLASSMGTFNALLRQLGEVPSLTKAQDYATLDAPETAYSAEMESPGSYFQPTEAVITSFDDLHGAITELIGKTPGLPLVWRGAKDAEWGLHSNLYRHLMEVNEVIAPSEKPKKAQPYPDEDRMVAAERAILRIARNDWRFDDLSALETFARIQHAGGPTRLIDVTKNPYVGAWFAVELDRDKEDKDARLFALATRPVAQSGKPPAPDSNLRLDDLGAARDPFWHLLPDTSARQQLDWGTGARRRIWVPPAYDPRISAQNAAFILDGVPMTSAATAPYFRIRRDAYWRRADLLASGSIYAKMLKPTLEPRYTVRNFAPTFSFRIKAEAKAPIRDVMESRFGYRLSYIYPDMAALAGQLKTLPLDG